jgi:DGQHR domain-containing protein
MARKRQVLQKAALLLQQDDAHPLFMLSLTGAELLEVADVSRVSRDDAGKLIGYQRAEVRRHVQSIVEYLNSERVLFPNSIILAFSPSVQFRRRRGPAGADPTVSVGVLDIPLARNGRGRPAWIVDGQQRALALSKSRRRDILVPVNGFIAADVAIQRDQFVRVNNTKPLPRGLVTELLPEIDTVLPPRLAARRIPSALVDVLNQHPDSPFFGLVKRASRSGPTSGVIADTSLVAMLEESLVSPSGCLFAYRNLATGETDFEAIRQLLFLYWTAVRETFPDAWGKTPKQSRLMHGAGIKSMGRLMDRVMGQVSPSQSGLARRVRRELAGLAPACHWTEGRWPELDLRWNELQNVPRHIRGLSNYLLRRYLEVQGYGS